MVDPDGSGVAGARVFALRDGTKVRRATLADEQGFYLFPPLPPGTWDVEASAEGYTTAVVGDVRLAVAQSRRLRLELEPADAQEMLTFYDYEPLARTGYEIGLGLDRWELADLPLRTRTVEELASLAPAPAREPARMTRIDGALTEGVLVDEYRAESVMLSALEGVAILDHSYGAEFGGASGAVSLMTRSGGAARIGSAFLLYRDEDLDAPVRRSHFGASLGGPIGQQTSRKGSHFFAAAELVDTSNGFDRRSLLVRGSRHDRETLLNWRYLGLDVESLDIAPSERSDRSDSLSLGWQIQISPSVVHDFLIQAENVRLGAAGGDVRVRQIRSDLYVAVASGAGFHDLAFGAESLQRENGGDTWSEGETEDWSLYVRDRWQVSDRLMLTGGLRSEFFETEGRRADGLSPRFGATWSLTDDGSHLLRGGAGRFRDLTRQRDVEQLSLGWSWQMGPLLGITLDAVTVDSDDLLLEYDAVAVSVRSRFSDVFQVRASFTHTEFNATDFGGTETVDDREDDSQGRAVVTGLYRAPADVLVAAVYRSEPLRAEPSGFDLRLAKGVQVSGDVSLEVLAEVFDVFEEHVEGGRMGQLGLRLSF